MFKYCKIVHGCAAEENGLYDIPFDEDLGGLDGYYDSYYDFSYFEGVHCSQTLVFASLRYMSRICTLVMYRLCFQRRDVAYGVYR